MANLLQRVKQWFAGKPADAAQPMRVKVDAAQTTDENKRQWANADALGPNAAVDPGTRARCRNRGRYETLNNGYCRSLVRSLSYDLVGTCPRLQLSIPASDDGTENADAAKIVERKFAHWSLKAGMGLKYRILDKCASRDGGGFLVQTTNMRLADPVKVDWRGVEDEQCQSPFNLLRDPFTIDGITFDENGNPSTYYFLKYHPGETIPGLINQPTQFVPTPAERVIHWFEKDRFGQMRGLPRITAGLPLFGQVRRFSLATLTAAEIAAMLAGIMKTNLPPGTEQATSVESWNLYELVRGALLTLPEGWDATQFKPEQPTTTYAEFKQELLGEAGRGSGAPLNITTGNSSGYNFSSGRLDHLPYQRIMKIDRYDFRSTVLDPVFLAWLEEAMLIPGYLPANLPPVEEWAWSWNYDGFGSVDPTKDAAAKDMRLKNGTTTHADVLAEDGDDWQDVFDQLAREKAYAESKGLPWPLFGATTPGMPAAPPADGNAPPPQDDAGARHRDGIRAALEDAGLDEAKADETADLLSAWIARGTPFSCNGHVHAGGTR